MSTVLLHFLGIRYEIVKGIAICYTLCLYEKEEALNMVQSDYHYLIFSGQFTVANPYSPTDHSSEGT